MKRIYICAGAALITVLDQLTKHMVAGSMSVGQSIPVLKGFFHITYIKNTGAAFGSFSDGTLALTLITGLILAAAFVFTLIKTKELGAFVTACLVMVLGGGLGNLIDRAVLGYVTDFLDFKIWNPVFNVADIFVCIGCGLLIVYLIFFEGKENER